MLEEQFDTLVTRLAGRFAAQSAVSSAFLSAEEFSANDFFNVFSEHPLFALTSLAEDYSPANRSLGGDLAPVIGALQNSIDNGSITSLDAALAITLLQTDLSSSPEAFRDLITEAIVESGIDASSDFTNILSEVIDNLVNNQGLEIISGTSEADTLTGSAEEDFIVGGQGDDILEGAAASDTLLGGAGDDILNGGRDRDTYIFFRNQGDDRIIEDSSVYLEVDTVSFEDDTTIDDVVTIYDGDNLVISFRNGEGSITIVNYASDSSSSDRHQVDRFTFSDGTTLDRADFIAATLGSQGNDTFNGSGENDTFIVRAGQGDDTIVLNSAHYQEVDTLRFEDGVTAADIYATYVGDDLVIGFRNDQGTITILNDGSSSAISYLYQINQFVFADGTTLNREGFLAATLGTSGNDAFNGSGENDTFIVRAGLPLDLGLVPSARALIHYHEQHLAWHPVDQHPALQDRLRKSPHPQSAHALHPPSLGIQEFLCVRPQAVLCFQQGFHRLRLLVFHHQLNRSPTHPEIPLYRIRQRPVCHRRF